MRSLSTQIILQLFLFFLTPAHAEPTTQKLFVVLSTLYNDLNIWVLFIVLKATVGSETRWWKDLNVSASSVEQWILLSVKL